MTVVMVKAVDGARVVGLARQLLVVVLINIPTVSYGLAMGWVSLASGEGGDGEGEGAGARVVVAAATTCLAALVGLPLSARALVYGRKFAVVATSACFVLCWTLKLVGGGWWVVAARVAAGIGGAGAFSIPLLVASEMCEEQVSGAASSAQVLAYNLGFLLMYVAADQDIRHSTVSWCCLGVSVLHCALFALVPESPAFLAANGRKQEAGASLAWLRGLPAGHPALAAELAALPPPDPAPFRSFGLLKDMLGEPGRRRAFIISFITIVGQEACGIFTLLQFAERVFMIARDEGIDAASIQNNSIVISAVTNLSRSAGNYSDSVMLTDSSDVMMSPARQAVILGAVQLVASAIGLYLVEKVGRRRLLVWSAIVTALCLAGGGGALAAGGGGAGARRGAGAALAAAVGADSAGLQGAPYAMLADMFHYQHRSCALMVITGATDIANALEVALFPALVEFCGLFPALFLAAALTGAYALFALLAVPETKGLSPEEIYALLAPKHTKDKDGSCVNEKYSYTTRV